MSGGHHRLDGDEFEQLQEPKKIQSVTASTFSPSICQQWMGHDAMIVGFVFFNVQGGIDGSQNSYKLSFIHFSSVAQSGPTLCDPMDCSTPGLPVLHQLPELAQTHVHRVSDAIQPSHPLLSPSPLAFNLS